MIVGFSPAKANLFFKVISKRPDGYHEVASLYTALSLGDYLSINKSEHDGFSSNVPSLLNDDSNLIIKARNSFRSATNIIEPLFINLKKNIPIGSGLGGGSSNAATVLWTLNELFSFPLSLGQLIRLGAEIGSDVPFFFSKGRAYCTGRGEILEERDFAIDESFVVANPDGYSLSTPAVYGLCKPTGNIERVDLYINDLEPAAFSIIPELRSFKKNLLDLGFSSVVMTGSGSAFLCFGKVNNPYLENTTFYPVTTIQRDQENWYGDVNI